MQRAANKEGQPEAVASEYRKYIVQIKRLIGRVEQELVPGKADEVFQVDAQDA